MFITIVITAIITTIIIIIFIIDSVIVFVIVIMLLFFDTLCNLESSAIDSCPYYLRRPPSSSP